MGSSITLAAALSGFELLLCDIDDGVLTRAKKSIADNLQFLTEKKKITSEASSACIHRIQFTGVVEDCKADLVIEAIVENLPIKEKLLQQLASVNGVATILASNTSSLSISVIQQNVPQPGRVAGMHFFNPAHVMKLVEVVKGKQTSDDVTEALMQLCRDMNKVPVLCNDAPGFIVNRVARHYYLQAMDLLERKVASLEDIDAAMEAAGFKMGPFKLMDLIGMDVNLAVSTSLYEAFDKAERFAPSQVQVEKVQQGELGRKSGKGFYNYS